MGGRKQRWISFGCLALLAGSVAGCNIIGAAAAKMPKPDIEAAYKGLGGQTVGVMVWADQGTRIDWNNIQLDLANGVDLKLKYWQTAGKSKDLELTTFPVEPRSIVRYQREHPALDTAPIITVAPKLGVSRLVYIEVKHLSTRSEEALTLYRGECEVSLRVLEIKNGTAKVAYEEPSIRVTFPKNAPAEGVLNAGDSKIYNGTVNTVTDEIVYRLVQHPDDTP